jgi:hypothetical protein
MTKLLSVPTWIGSHYVSLAELLLLIGSKFINAEWYIRTDEAVPVPGGEVLELLNKDNSVDIFHLFHLVTPDIQIIDGEIIAKSDNEICLAVKAVDGSTWDIVTKDNDVYSIIENHYGDFHRILIMTNDFDGYWRSPDVSRTKKGANEGRPA